MYLIEDTPNQSHQANIYSLRKPSYNDIFLINSTIKPLHTNTAPKTPSKNIGFSPHCHTPATTTVNHASPVHQHLQCQFQPAVSNCQHIENNITHATQLPEENGCDLSKLLPLLCNLTLKDDTLISLKLLWWNFSEPHILHQCHYNTPFLSLLPYTSIPVLWRGIQYLHAPIFSSKMVKLLQWQSIISNPNQMTVDGGDNFHYFGYKHLFYILFVIPTSVHVSGRSTF